MSVYMNDIIIFKAAYDMDDGFDFPDMTKELVAKAFSLRCALDKSGNIAKLNRSINIS